MGEQGQEVSRHRSAIAQSSIAELVVSQHPEPATAKTLGQVSNCDLEDFKTAINDAYIAQPKYFESTTAAQRGAALRRWNDLILANKQDSEYFFETVKVNFC